MNKDIPEISENKKGKPVKSEKSPKSKRLSNLTIWTVKVVVVTFALSAFFSYLSEITTGNAPTAVAFILLILLIVINVIFDAIAVAVTSCELAPLLSMASRKVKGSVVAIKLVKNAEKVSNICGDVIGDICGIISGACTVAIVVKLLTGDGSGKQYLVTIIFSSVVAAFTVGGKAVFKEIAIKNSKEMMLMVGRILSVVYKKN
jgi:Hemolysins and related proteins containing CBS domains